ncbi:MAG: hypothetical protein J4452_01765 [Candidatus Aenigmarchaeota archaeon]|nr:hypothetical protein [Candidatus Aenigmarchaeota archaeon]
MEYVRRQGLIERTVRGVVKYVPVGTGVSVGIIGYALASSGTLVSQGLYTLVTGHTQGNSVMDILYNARNMGMLVGGGSGGVAWVLSWKMKNDLLDWFFGKP